LPATRVTTGAVRSYRTFSPLLPRASRRATAVCFLCHFPSGCPDRALPGALPCGVRTFLPSSRLRRCGGQAHRSTKHRTRAIVWLAATIYSTWGRQWTRGPAAASCLPERRL